jgi:erythromycin esterase-like protein
MLNTMFTSLDEWIGREAIPFSLDSPREFLAAVDGMVKLLGDSVELLGLGEPMHGGEEFLLFRNRLFQRLVEAHGFCSIAVESSFPRGRVVDEYVAGRGGESYDDVREAGFSHGFGALETNRELVEWMRAYNSDASRRVKLRFYGFDSPTEMMYSDSPRTLICQAVDYFTAVDAVSGEAHRVRVEAHLGEDADWENPAANMDPSKSVGLSAGAAALRIDVEELLSELRVRRPELVAASNEERYLDAVHYASSARHLLNYHAGVARTSERRLMELLGIRDLMMADNLAYMVERERGRGRVFAFAHNSHLKRGRAEWQLGPQLLAWWPAGAHLSAMLGRRYEVIGTGVGVSEGNGIGEPEVGSLEALLRASPRPGRLIATHWGRELPAAEIAALPMRSGSVKNPSYFPFTPQSFTDFDWLAVLDSATYSRGGPALG